MNGDSPFLQVPQSDWVTSNEFAFAIRDGYPVSPGHTLVVPHRLIAHWDATTTDERLAIFSLIDEVKAGLRRTHQPDGFNLGINEGAAAGQTVFHLHVHVIPRYAGDVADPRGGVRHAVMGKGNWETAEVAADDP